MIEQLVLTLRALAHDAAAPADVEVRAACADAVRLELDCPQQSLTTTQRSTLRSLGDLLEEPASDAAAVAAAARAAAAALGRS